MDSFLLTLKSTTMKKFGLEWLKISIVVAYVPWKCMALCSFLCIVYCHRCCHENRNCSHWGLSFASFPFSLLGFWCNCSFWSCCYTGSQYPKQDNLCNSNTRLLKSTWTKAVKLLLFRGTYFTFLDLCGQEGIWILNNSYSAHSFGHSNTIGFTKPEKCLLWGERMSATINWNILCRKLLKWIEYNQICQEIIIKYTYYSGHPNFDFFKRFKLVTITCNFLQDISLTSSEHHNPSGLRTGILVSWMSTKLKVKINRKTNKKKNVFQKFVPEGNIFSLSIKNMIMNKNATLGAALQSHQNPENLSLLVSREDGKWQNTEIQCAT